MSNKKLMLLALGLISLGASLWAATDSVLMRVYADRYDSQVDQLVSYGTTAAFDTAFGSNGGKDLTSQLGAGVVIKAMAISADGWLYVAADNGSTNVKLAKFDADGILDDSFGIATISRINVKDICIDSDGYLLLCGGDGSAAGWLTRYTSAGIIDPLFTVGSAATVGTGVVLHKVAEQRSGRIVASASNGRVYAFRSTGVDDTTFNPNQTALNYYTVSGGNSIANMIVDDNDDMFVAYLDTTIKIAKLDAEGAGLVSAYGTSGVFNTSATPMSATQFKMVQDNNGRFIISYVDASSGLYFRRYTSSGSTLDTDFSADGIQSITSLGTNGQFKSTGVYGGNGIATLYYDNATSKIKRVSDNAIIATALSTIPTATTYTITSADNPTYNGSVFRKVSLTLADLVVDENDQILALLYDDNATIVTLVVRVNADGSFDTDFSSDGVATDTSNSLDVVYALGVHPDGSILIAGDDQYSSASHSKLARLFGDVYDGQYVQAQSVIAAGTYDDTFNDSGTLDIVTALSLAGSLKKIHIYSDGSMLLVTDNGSDTQVAKLQPDRTLDTSFATATSGVYTFTGLTGVNDLFIAQDGSIFVTGGTNTEWLRKLSSAGIIDPLFSYSAQSSIGYIQKCAQQSSGRIIAVGKDHTAADGVIVGLKPTGAVDSTIFGLDGTGTAVISGVTNGFYDVAVDQYDRIYVPYKDETGHVDVQRFTEYGSVETLIINAVTDVDSASEVRIAIDPTNSWLVVAAISSNNVVFRKYTYNTTSTITAVGGILTVSINSSLIGKLFIDDAQQTYVVTTNTSGEAVSVRLNSSFALDSTYGASGVATTTGTSITVTDAALHPDRRVLIVGGSNMRRLYGDQYTLVRSESIAIGTAGTKDTNSFIAGAGVLDYSTSVANGQFKNLHVFSDGTVLATVDTGSATKIIKLIEGSFALDTTWQTDGIVGTDALTGVQDLLVDQDGKFILAGTTEGASWVKRYTAAGDVDTGFGTSGTVASNITAGYKLVQQASGRILLCGLNSGAGAIKAYSDAGVLDETFGSSGVYTLGTTAFYDAIVDAQDRIIVAYMEGSDLDIVAVRSNGFSLDSDFATSGRVDAAISNVVSADQIRIVKDSNGKLLVVAVTSAGVYVRRYTAAGAVDTSFNSTGAARQVSSNADIRITDVDLDENNIIVVSGYDSSATNNRSWIARVAANGSSVLSTVSYEVSSADNTGQVNATVIYPDGRILAAGHENDGSNNKPKLTRVYHDPFVLELTQTVSQGSAGQLDIVFDGEGFTTSQLSTSYRNQYGRALIDIANGKFVIGSYGYSQADETYTHFLVGRVTSDGELDTTFGTGSTGYFAVPLYTDETSSIDENNEYLRAVGLDNDSKLVAVGYRYDGSVSTGLIKRILADGSDVDVTFNADGPTPGTVAQTNAQLYGMAFQSSGRVIAVGRDTNIATVNDGMLLACDIHGVLDAFFGVDGKAYINDAQEIYSIVVDAADGILVAYKSTSTGHVNVAKFQPNGFSLDTDYGTSGKALAVISDASGYDRVHLALDADGKVVVAASVTTSNAVKVRRLLTTGAVDTSFNTDGSALTVTSHADNIAVVQKVIVDSAGSIIIAGYTDVASTTQDTLFFARVTSAGALDSAFASTGVSNLSTDAGDANQKIHDAIVSTEGKICAVGSMLANGASVYNTTFVSVYSDPYEYGLDRNPVFAADVGLDTSFGTDGVFASFANGNYARGVQVLSTGLSLVALDDGTTGQWLARMTAEGALDTSFQESAPDENDGGYATITATGDVESITEFVLDGRGRSLVVGTSDGAGFIKRLTTAGAMDTTFNTTGWVYDTDFTTITSVVELSSGVIIVAGISTAGTGILKAYSSVDGSEITTSAAAGGFATSGVYTDTSTGVSGVYSLVSDNLDNVYAAIGYVSSGVKKLRIVKLNSSGVLVSSFGSGGVVDVALTGLYDKSLIRIALDANDEIVVGGTKSDGRIAVKRYTVAGIVDSDFNAGSEYTFGNVSDGPVNFINKISDIVILDSNKIMVSASKDDASEDSAADRLVLARVTAAGILDTSFNDTGLFEFVATETFTDSRLTAFDIQADGNVVAVGYDMNASNEVNPLIVRAYGDDYIAGVPRFAGFGFIGTLDGTFGVSNDGKAPIYFGAEHGIAQYAAGVYAFSNEKPIVYGYGYTDTDTTYQHVLSARLTSSGDYDTSYGGGAGTIPGAIVSSLSASNSEIVNHMLVDHEGRFLVAGYIDQASDQGFIRRYNVSGALDSTFATSGVLTYAATSQIKALGIQGLGGKIIAAGNRNGTGFVARYFTTGQIDTAFGSSGTGTFTKLETVHSVVVGANDIIYVAQTASDNTLQIVAIKRDGTGLYKSFGINGKLTVLSGLTSHNGIWLALDANNKLVIGASVDDGDNSYIVVKRYTTSATLDAAFNVAGADWSDDSSVTINALSRILVDESNQVIIVGYENTVDSETNTDYLLAVRLTSALALDENFGENQDGFFRARVYSPGGKDSQFADGYITSTGKILLAGHETPVQGGSTPVVVRVNGDYGVGQVRQYPEFVALPQNIQPQGQVAGTPNSITALQESANLYGSGVASHAFANSSPVASHGFVTNQASWNSGGVGGGWGGHRGLEKPRNVLSNHYVTKAVMSSGVMTSKATTNNSTGWAKGSIRK